MPRRRRRTIDAHLHVLSSAIFTNQDIVDVITASIFGLQGAVVSSSIFDVTLSAQKRRYLCAQLIVALIRLSKVSTHFKKSCAVALQDLVTCVSKLHDDVVNSGWKHLESQPEYFVNPELAHFEDEELDPFDLMSPWPPCDDEPLQNNVERAFGLLFCGSRNFAKGIGNGHCNHYYRSKATFQDDSFRMCPYTLQQLWMFVTSRCACCGQHCKTLLRQHVASRSPNRSVEQLNSPCEVITDDWQSECYQHPYLGIVYSTNYLQNPGSEMKVLERNIPFTSNGHFVKLEFCRIVAPAQEVSHATFDIKLTCFHSGEMQSIDYKCKNFLNAMRAVEPDRLQYHLQRLFEARLAEIQRQCSKEVYEEFLQREWCFRHDNRFYGEYTFTAQVPLFDFAFADGIMSNEHFEQGRTADYSVAQMFGLSNLEVKLMCEQGKLLAIRDRENEVAETETWRVDELSRRLALLNEQFSGMNFFFCSETTTEGISLNHWHNATFFRTWSPYAEMLSAPVTTIKRSRKFRKATLERAFSDASMIDHFQRLIIIIGAAYDEQNDLDVDRALAGTPLELGERDENLATLLQIVLAYMHATKRHRIPSPNWLVTFHEPHNPTHADVFLRFFFARFLNHALEMGPDLSDGIKFRMHRVYVSDVKTAVSSPLFTANQLCVQLSLSVGPRREEGTRTGFDLGTSRKRIVFSMSVHEFSEFFKTALSDYKTVRALRTRTSLRQQAQWRCPAVVVTVDNHPLDASLNHLHLNTDPHDAPLAMKTYKRRSLNVIDEINTAMVDNGPQFCMQVLLKLFKTKWHADEGSTRKTENPFLQLAFKHRRWGASKSEEHDNWYEQVNPGFCQARGLDRCLCSCRCTFSGRCGSVVFGERLRPTLQTNLDAFVNQD